MTESLKGDADLNLSEPQYRVLRQVLEILQLDETGWKPLAGLVEAYHAKMFGRTEGEADASEVKELVNVGTRSPAAVSQLRYATTNSLRNRLERFLFAASLLLGQRTPLRKEQPVIAEKDLESNCEMCNGSGYVQHPEWKAWWREYSLASVNHHPFPNVKEEIVCPNCGGKGTVLTAQGRILVDSLKKHMK